ncbi:VIN3-like protein 2 [Bidens hawaiensis]|uniref:VIN3-like protein 2 n=1 Tax=Bidens hawaiensis TaxID=980011 RepID=UPI00404A2B64
MEPENQRQMEPKTLKKTRKVGQPRRYQQIDVPPVEVSATPAQGEGPMLSGLGRMVNPDSSKVDGQSTSRRLDLNSATAPEVIVDTDPVNVSSRDQADLSFGGSKNRAPHGHNEAAPPRVTGKSPASRAAHIALEYRGGPGNYGLNFEHNMKVIHRLECESLITAHFREKLLTWFCLRATEHHRKVVNAFVKILKDDQSLARQLEHTFGGIIDADR